MGRSWGWEGPQKGRNLGLLQAEAEFPGNGDREGGPALASSLLYKREENLDCLILCHSIEFKDSFFLFLQRTGWVFWLRLHWVCKWLSFPVLILSNHEPRMSFHIFVPFFRDWKFSVQGSFTSLVRFTHSYLLSLRLLWRGGCPWSPSPYVCCWWVENLLISTGRFCTLPYFWNYYPSLAVSWYKFQDLLSMREYHLHTEIVWPLLFLLFVSFNCFSWLPAPASASSTIFERSRESAQPILLLIWVGFLQVFFMKVMLVVYFSYLAFIS